MLRKVFSVMISIALLVSISITGCSKDQVAVQTSISSQSPVSSTVREDSVSFEVKLPNVNLVIAPGRRLLCYGQH